jgi:hypothetical protein
LPVAILGSDSFNVNNIVLESIKLNGVRLATKGSDKTARTVNTVKDVNGDGYTDLLCYFDNQALALTTADTKVALLLTLNDGSLYEGFDNITVTGK